MQVDMWGDQRPATRPGHRAGPGTRPPRRRVLSVQERPQFVSFAGVRAARVNGWPCRQRPKLAGDPALAPTITGTVQKMGAIELIHELRNLGRAERLAGP